MIISAEYIGLENFWFKKNNQYMLEIEENKDNELKARLVVTKLNTDHKLFYNTFLYFLNDWKNIRVISYENNL